jgi:hypothetical protein
VAVIIVTRGLRKWQVARKGAVGLASLEVERGIGIDDLRDVILLPYV